MPLTQLHDSLTDRQPYEEKEKWYLCTLAALSSSRSDTLHWQIPSSESLASTGSEHSLRANTLTF